MLERTVTRDVTRREGGRRGTCSECWSFGFAKMEVFYDTSSVGLKQTRVIKIQIQLLLVAKNTSDGRRQIIDNVDEQ